MSPIYEFFCGACKKNYEETLSYSELIKYKGKISYDFYDWKKFLKFKKCPNCGLTGKLTKEISKFGFSLKGKGWFNNEK